MLIFGIPVDRMLRWLDFPQGSLACYKAFLCDTLEGIFTIILNSFA
jgi:hypothetical protein